VVDGSLNGGKLNAQNIFNFWLQLSKSPCTGEGLPTPLSCKVPSATDLAQPEYDYLNSSLKILQMGGCKVKTHAPIYGGERWCKVPSATDLAGDRGWLPLSCAR